MSKKDDGVIQVGAGWKRETKKGNVYVRVSLDVNQLAELTPDGDKIWVNMFRVNEKKSEKSPDYTLVVFTEPPKQKQDKKEEEDAF